MRDLEGHLVGWQRQCRPRDRTPKKVYTDAEIVEWSEKHGGGKYEPYRCDFGHWHVGNKLRRPIVSYD